MKSNIRKPFSFNIFLDLNSFAFKNKIKGKPCAIPGPKL